MADKKSKDAKLVDANQAGVTDPTKGEAAKGAGDPKVAETQREQLESVPQVQAPESAHEVNGEPRKSVAQQQTDPHGTLTNRPGTDEDGRVPADAPQSEKQSAVQRGEDRSIDSILSDDGKLTVNGSKRDVTEVFSPYQDRRVFADADGSSRFYVVNGNEVEQTLTPNTPGHDAYVNQRSAAEQNLKDSKKSSKKSE